MKTVQHVSHEVHGISPARTRKILGMIAPAGIVMALLTLSACADLGNCMDNRASSETELTNKRTVDAIYAGFQSGDVEAIIAQVADDVVWIVPGPKSIPFADRFVGKDGVRRFFRAVSDNSEVIELTVLDTISLDDRVVVTGREHMRVPATGKEYRSRWVHNYRLRNGKVIEFEEFADTADQAASFTPDPTK